MTRAIGLGENVPYNPSENVKMDKMGGEVEVRLMISEP